MDTLDKQILQQIQTNFPLAEDPYGVLGAECGMSGDEVYRRVQELCKEGLIRRLGPSFSSHHLGFHGTLVAAKVPPEQVDEVAQIIGSYSEVTHNYLRKGKYNVWFTILAQSVARIEEIVEEIKSTAQIDDVLNLPATKLFKIDVQFAVGENDGGK